jgi:hypothetical protein
MNLLNGGLRSWPVDTGLSMAPAKTSRDFDDDHSECNVSNPAAPARPCSLCSAISRENPDISASPASNRF